MGLFSSKRLYTSTQMLALVDDTPEIIKQSIMNSILNDGDIVPEMLDTINSCLANSVDDYHRYGKDHFTNGLPEGDMGYLAVDIDVLTKAFNKYFPLPTGEEYYFGSAIVDGPLLDTFAIEYLSNTMEDFHWNTNTWIDPNDPEKHIWTYWESALLEPSKLKITSVRLVDVAPPLDPPEWEEVWDHRTITTKEPIYFDQRYYTVNYYIKKNGLVDESTFTVWTYWENSHKYPELNVPDDELSFTRFMPIVPLRINNVDLTADKESNLYKTSKKLLDKIDLKIDEMSEGINASPDIDDIDHAYFILGVDIKSDKQPTINYLYLFFRDLFTRSKYKFEDTYRWWAGVTSGTINTPPVNILNVKDGTYNTKLVWYYVKQTFEEGSIGKVGTVTRTIDYLPAITLTEQSPNGTTIRSFIVEHPNSLVTFKCQISPNQYEVIEVSGLMFSNTIYGPDKDHIITLEPKEGEKIIVPINLSIVADFRKLDANTLYYDAFHIVFNAYEWVKLKWYETGFFKFVTTVIAIAITIVSAGSMSGLSSALVGIASAGVTSIALAVGEFVLGTILTQVVFKFAAEHLGIEFAMVFAAVMMAYGAFGSDSMFGLPFANDVLSIANIGMKAIQEVIGEEFLDIQTEMTEFAEESEDKMKELEDLTSELSPQVTLDPIGLYTSVGMLPNESADMFLNRSLLADTVGPTLGSIGSFVDNSLRLDFY